MDANALVKHLLQRPVAGRVARGALVANAALRHHHQLVGVQGHADFMQRADHGSALGHQLLHHRQPVGLVRRVQIGQGFVHQQHLGLYGQGTGQQHALAFTSAKLAQAAAAPAPGLGGLQSLLHGGMVGGAGRGQPGLVRQAAQHGHVPHRQIVGTGFVLTQPGQQTGALAVRYAMQRAAQQTDLPLVRQQASQAFEQGGFARTIGANNTGPLPGGDVQRQLVQHLHLGGAKP